MLCLNCHLKITSLTPEHYGLHASCFQQWFKTEHLEEFVSLQKRTGKGSSGETTAPSSQNTSFFHGKFKKYSANLGQHAYILKMRQEDAPELPEVEYLCNQIGDLLEIPIAQCYLINFNGERTFVTKNFISPGEPINLEHIYHFRADDQHSCEGIIQSLIKHSHNTEDVPIFIKTLLFDALIGNNDRHGRNLAFLVMANNTALSPIYDNVSYLSLEQGNMLKADFNPTGKISTQATKEPSMCDYVIELNRLGYKEKILSFYNTVNLPKINQVIDESFCGDLMKMAIKKLIKKRFEELHHVLFN